MIGDCKAYLETLMRRVDPDYSCRSCRSGAWAIAPSEHILDVLVKQGIEYDMRMCKGVKYDNAVVRLDYTGCDEDMLPFYPEMADSRRVSTRREAIICVPTFSLNPGRISSLSGDLVKVWAKLRSRISANFSDNEPSQKALESYSSSKDYSVWESDSGGIAGKIRRRLSPEVTISDLSALTYPMMRDMIGAIRRSAEMRSARNIPVILENHTKDIIDFTAIKRFAAYISKQQDLEVITLKQLADRFTRGDYEILTRAKAPA